MSDKPKRQPNAGSFKPGESGRSRKRRADAWQNEISGHGTIRDRLTHTMFAPDIVTDTEAMWLWRTEWLCAKVIETRPREAFRRGYELDFEDKGRAEKLAAIGEDLPVSCGDDNAKGVDTALVKAAEYARAYGGAAILPDMDGALGDLSEPLYEDGISEVVSLRVLEPRELVPVRRYTTGPKRGQVEIWRLIPVTGSTGLYQLIHESRLIIMQGIRVSAQSQAGQRDGWGDSELCRPIQLIKNLGMSLGSATTILGNYGRDVLQLKGWAELAAQAGNGDQGAANSMDSRIARFDMRNTALRLGVLDAEDRITTRGGQSLSGIEKILETQAHFVAAAVNIPISVLLDMAPGSLNATGDMNVRNWYASVEQEREAKYKSPLEQIYRWLMWSRAVEIEEPQTWSAKFRPLWTPSEKEQAETRKLDMERAVLAVKEGIASADDIAHSFYDGDGYSGDIKIDWAARKKQQAIEKQQAADLDRAALAALGRAPADPTDPNKRDPVVDEDGPGIGRTFAGLPIVVEHPRGTWRERKAPDGTTAATKMLFDYGYIVGSEGEDGDSVDVYLGRNEEPTHAYVIRQMKAPDFVEYDEDKVMIGFDSENHARDAYLAQYDDDRFFGGVEAVKIDAFRERVLGDAS